MALKQKARAIALQLRTMVNENIKLALGLAPLQLLVYTNADGARYDRLGVHDADT